MPWINAYLTDYQINLLISRLDRIMANQALIATGQDRQTRTLEEIYHAVKTIGNGPSLTGIERLLSGIKFSLSRPGRLSIAQLGEDAMQKILFEVALPGLAAPDVVKRELTVQIAGVVTTTVLEGATLNDATVGGLKGLQDAALHLELVDIDDAGNRSQPSVFDGVLVDTFAPPAPGQLGIKAIGEDFTEDPPPPAPEPEPVPEPTPEPVPEPTPVETV